MSVTREQALEEAETLQRNNHRVMSIQDRQDRATTIVAYLKQPETTSTEAAPDMKALLLNCWHWGVLSSEFPQEILDDIQALFKSLDNPKEKP